MQKEAFHETKAETSLKRVMEQNYLNGHLRAQNIVGETTEELWNWAIYLTT